MAQGSGANVNRQLQVKDCRYGDNKLQLQFTSKLLAMYRK